MTEHHTPPVDDSVLAGFLEKNWHPSPTQLRSLCLELRALRARVAHGASAKEIEDHTAAAIADWLTSNDDEEQRLRDDIRAGKWRP